MRTWRQGGRGFHCVFVFARKAHSVTDSWLVSWVWLVHLMAILPCLNGNLCTRRCHPHKWRLLFVGPTVCSTAAGWHLMASNGLTLGLLVHFIPTSKIQAKTIKTLGLLLFPAGTSSVTAPSYPTTKRVCPPPPTPRPHKLPWAQAGDPP